MTEKELQHKLLVTFSGFNDIEIVLKPDIRRYNWIPNKCKIDAVIEYGNCPFAIFETKSNQIVDKDSIKKQLYYYRNSTNIKCYIVYDNDKYYYYNIDNRESIEKDLDLNSILEILLQAIDSNKEEASKEEVESLIEVVKNINQVLPEDTDNKLKKYKELFCEHINKDAVEKHGNILFMDRKIEMELMYNLLSYEAKERDRKVENKETVKSQEQRLCRYMSAKTFFDSLKSGSLRLSSIETFNDVFETRAIRSFSKLNDTRRSISERLYNGFVMCFSDIEREDKLYNWHMYGGNAEGVCLSVEKKKEIPEEKNDMFFFAPVTYVKMARMDSGDLNENDTCDLLNFLNRIMGMEIEGSRLSFNFRLWHYWKFFFKYNFYEEEMEARLVFITKDQGNPDWNDYYKCPYRYVQKCFYELPFKITNVILGPRCGRENFTKEVFDSMVGEVHQGNFNVDHVNKSIIKGYKG